MKLFAGNVAQSVNLAAPGRVGTFHLVDGENGVLVVVNIEMLVESHTDCGDFFA